MGTLLWIHGKRTHFPDLLSVVPLDDPELHDFQRVPAKVSFGK